MSPTKREQSSTTQIVVAAGPPVTVYGKPEHVARRLSERREGTFLRFDAPFGYVYVCPTLVLYIQEGER